MHIIDNTLIDYSEPAGHYGGLETGDVIGWATGGNYAIQVSSTPPGGGGYSHDHADMDQIFYVLEGEYEFTENDRTETLTQGQAVLFKAGEPHASVNKTQSTVRCLVITVKN